MDQVILKAIRQFTGHIRGDLFTVDSLRAAELLRKSPAIVELVAQARPAKVIPAQEAPVAVKQPEPAKATTTEILHREKQHGRHKK